MEREEELQALALAQSGDLKAVDRIYRACVRYMLQFATRFAKEHGVGTDELLAEMNVGFMEALPRFDRSFGCRFLTYASSWFLKVCEAYVAANRAPGMDTTLTPRERLAYNELKGGNDDVAAICAKHKMRASTVEHALALHHMRSASMDAPASLAQFMAAGRPSRGATLREVESKGIATDDRSAEDVLCADEESRAWHEALDKALAKLTPRRRAILLDRMSPEPKTLQELGEEHGITRQRVHQIELKARWAVTKLVHRFLGRPIPPAVKRPRPRKIVCTHCKHEGHEARRCSKRRPSTMAKVKEPRSQEAAIPEATATSPRSTRRLKTLRERPVQLNLFQKIG